MEIVTLITGSFICVGLYVRITARQNSTAKDFKMSIKVMFIKITVQVYIHVHVDVNS